jgi:hypothetical protein
MTTPDQNGPSAPTDREAIEADIAATRADLGETVDALSRKLDVKSRVSAKAAETPRRVRGKAADTSDRVRREPAVPAGILAGVLLIVALVVWRRRS